MTTQDKIKWLRSHEYEVYENDDHSVIKDAIDVDGFCVNGPLETIVNEAYDFLSFGDFQ